MDESNISNLVKNSDLNKKPKSLTELKAEKNKIVKLKTYDLSYFLGKTFFG